jgi:hypothetical protein|nr:MAG TPA: hypothetical protein [Caudoviricetes sp.]
MIYLTILMALSYLLGIFYMREDRRQMKETIRTKESEESTDFRWIKFLKRTIVLYYIMETIAWFCVVFLVVLILGYFNLI